MDLALVWITFLGLAGGAAMLFAASAAGAERRPYRQLMGLVAEWTTPAGQVAAPTAAPPPPRPLRGLAEGLAARVSPAAAQRRLLRRLESAGVASRISPARFLGLRTLAAAASLPAGALTYSLLKGSPWQLLAVGAVVLLALVYPDLWLRGLREARQKLIRQNLPDVLDLLVLSVEVGLGFDAAVARVISKMDGPLVDELRRLLRDMQLGQTRGQGLRALAARCQVREVSSFTSAIVQAEQLGGSIAQALRVQARAIRLKASQRLREQAAKMPVKMLFPLIVFIFPAIFIVLLGPGLMSLAKAFG